MRGGELGSWKDAKDSSNRKKVVMEGTEAGFRLCIHDKRGGSLKKCMRVRAGNVSYGLLSFNMDGL